MVSDSFAQCFKWVAVLALWTAAVELTPLRAAIYSANNSGAMDNLRSTRINSSCVSLKSDPVVPSQDASWCPYAQCVNSPLCQPCSKRYLIIVATGRSASTTMLSMLNALPGVRLGGENNNLLFGIHKMFDRPMKVVKNFLKLTDPGGPWSHNKIRTTDVACTAQNVMELVNPPLGETQWDPALLKRDMERTIVGFKTIRFHQDWEDIDAAVEFVQTHFPCSRIVVNLNSNLSRQAESWEALGWSSKNKSEVEAVIADQNKRLEGLVEKFGKEQAFLMDTSVFSSDPDTGVSRVNDLVQWLGFKSCVFSQLLHANKDHTTKAATEKVSLGRDCRYGGNWSSV